MAIGDVQQFRDDRDAALESYEQALKNFRAIGSQLGEANVLLAIGLVQQFRKELDAALESYAQALKNFRAIGSQLGEANVLQSRGKLFLSADEDTNTRKKGFENFEQALVLYVQIGDRVGQTNIYSFLAQWFAGQGELNTALEYAQQALSLAMAFAPDHPVTEWLAGFTAEIKEKAGE